MQRTEVTTTDRPRLAPVPEAARRAQVSPKTIRNWFDQGLLTRYRLGARLVRADLNEIDTLAQPERAAR